MGGSLLIGLALTWWLTRDVAKLRAYARTVDTAHRTPVPDVGAPELKELGAALEAHRWWPSGCLPRPLHPGAARLLAPPREAWHFDLANPPEGSHSGEPGASRLQLAQ